jgi:hypothetical protein
MAIARIIAATAGRKYWSATDCVVTIGAVVACVAESTANEAIA